MIYHNVVVRQDRGKRRKIGRDALWLPTV